MYKITKMFDEIARGSVEAQILDKQMQAINRVKKITVALEIVRAKGAAGPLKGFRDIMAEESALRKILAKPYLLGNIEGAHTDASLRKVRNRLMTTLNLTRKQADAIMKLMFKDWRPQDVVKTKLTAAQKAAAAVMERIRAICGKPIPIGKVDVSDIMHQLSLLITKLNGVGGAARQAAQILSRISGPGLGRIPVLQGGGIVTRPTTALVGEAGPEAIIPLTRPGRAAQVMQQAGIGGPTFKDCTFIGSPPAEWADMIMATFSQKQGRIARGYT
jgi:hypothetical protein